MITLKPKTRRGTIILASVEDMVPLCARLYKTFKRLSPELKNMLQDVLDNPPSTITSMSALLNYIQDEVICLQVGARTVKELELLGWTNEEIAEHFTKLNKKQINGYRKKYGTKTPYNKEFWMICGMSEDDAIKKVSQLQTGNSNKVSKEQRRRQLKNVLDGIHYENLGQAEAKKLLSEHQRKQSKRCVEYWMDRGSSKDQSQKHVSAYQREQSPLNSEYWIKRGRSKEDAEDAAVRKTEEHMKMMMQLSKSVSKSSQRLFNDLASKMPDKTFLYGKAELSKSASKIGKRCFFLDFYDPSTNLCIEYDGEYWHKDRKAEDTARDKFLLEEYGIKTLRICSSTNYDEAVNISLAFIQGTP